MEQTLAESKEKFSSNKKMVKEAQTEYAEDMLAKFADELQTLTQPTVDEELAIYWKSITGISKRWKLIGDG